MEIMQIPICFMQIAAVRACKLKQNWAGIFSFQTGLTFVCYFVTFKLDIRIMELKRPSIVSLLLEIQIQFCFLYIGRY